jgi:AcrR family transcriptional regulator
MQLGTAVTVAVRAKRSRLSRQDLGRAGLEIVDREGMEGLTMRRLAEVLGVGKMTLYGHVRSKEELIDAIVDVAVGTADPPATEGTWREQLGALMRSRHESLNAHPGLVAIRFTRPVVRPDALRFGEAGMRILAAAGFDAGESARAFRLLFTYVVGYAGLSPQATVDEARRQAAVAIAGLPPDEYPHLTGAADAFSAAMAGEEQFEQGLELILDGLESRLRDRGPPDQA